SAHVRRCAAESAAERVAEVAVAGKAEVEGGGREVVGAVLEPFERRAQAQAGQVAMDRHAGTLLKKAGEMEGRSVHGAGDIVERDPLAQTCGQIGFGRLGAVGMSRIGAVAPAAKHRPRQAVARERRPQHLADNPQRGLSAPYRVDRFARFQSPYEVTMPLKNRLLARSRDERKPTLALPIFGDVKLTKDIAQHARRGRENSAAIAAF